jgi:hypothetical protein
MLCERGAGPQEAGTYIPTSIADMIGRIGEVVVDREPQVLAQFWSAVLGGAPCAR